MQNNIFAVFSSIFILLFIPRYVKRAKTATMNDYSYIIEKCRNGDKESFRIIVHDFQPVIFRLAVRIMGDTSEAEDITQETFIKAWETMEDFKLKSSFGTWLYRIACNKCFDRLRQIKKQEKANEQVENLSYDRPAENIEDEITNRELCRLITKYTNEMPPMQRLVFTLKDMEELSTEEICKITGITPLQLKSNLYFARKFIRNKLIKDKLL